MECGKRKFEQVEGAMEEGGPKRPKVETLFTLKRKREVEVAEARKRMRTQEPKEMSIDVATYYSMMPMHQPTFIF